jgi:hypothetical protein
MNGVHAVWGSPGLKLSIGMRRLLFGCDASESKGRLQRSTANRPEKRSQKKNGKIETK